MTSRGPRIAGLAAAAVILMSAAACGGTPDIKSVADFVALARSQPGELNYSTATGMTDMIYDGYFKSTGIAITRVAYRDVVAPMIDLAEWSYFFVGVERVELARGSFVNGKQMYVESFIPAQVRHPYPIVLVHGGG